MEYVSEQCYIVYLIGLPQFPQSPDPFHMPKYGKKLSKDTTNCTFTYIEHTLDMNT